MIRLAAFGRAFGQFDAPVMGRITRVPVETTVRPQHIYIASHPAAECSGYAGVIVTGAARQTTPLSVGVELDDATHLADGDIVSIGRMGDVRTLFRKSSSHNALFTTERCNSNCVMCSQPPRQVDDSWRVGELMRLVDLIPPDTRELGVTGGEPTLLEGDLIDLVRHCRARLPSTALHILTNGRRFRSAAYARALADVRHPDIMLGVPLYAADNAQHDYVVQAKGAFDDTVLGLRNLGRFDVPVEIRVVVHRHTVDEMLHVANFVYRNLTFAKQVVFMGLEPMGFAVPNFGDLWVDPWDYREALDAAVVFLAARGVKVAVYNHQLCTVTERIRPFCMRSISDWKNEFLDVCRDCTLRAQCCGFFSSSVSRGYSKHITPCVGSA